jgi:uncharacterized protein GlcG (DUF336 family)
MKLDVAQKIVQLALTKAREMKLKPMGVAVLDARGALRAVAVEDGASHRRFEIAYGKANAVIAMGLGSRALEQRAKERPYFMAAMPGATGAPFIPVTGAILIKDAAGTLLGAVGVSGDTSDNDEAIALAAVAAVGLTAQAD